MEGNKWNPIKGKGPIMLIFNKFHGETNLSEVEIERFYNENELMKFIDEITSKELLNFKIYGCYSINKEIEFIPAKIITKYIQK